MGMEESKLIYCPVSKDSVTIFMGRSESNEIISICIREKCAWWIENICADGPPGNQVIDRGVCAVKKIAIELARS